MNRFYLILGVGGGAAYDANHRKKEIPWSSYALGVEIRPEAVLVEEGDSSTAAPLPQPRGPHCT